MPVIRASVCKFAASKICLKVHLLPLVNRGGAERFSHASNLEKTLSKSKESRLYFLFALHLVQPQLRQVIQTPCFCFQVF